MAKKSKKETAAQPMPLSLTEPEEQKSIWKSKTFWFNLCLMVAGVLMAVADQIAAGGSLTAIGVINIILRVFTTQAIKK